MGYRHDMPFGAQVCADGRVRFRLWAPAAASVELQLPDAGLRLPMQAQDDGWFELLTGAAAAGNRYCFRLADGSCVPDPASRFQPDDVHGASQVIEPRDYAWQDHGWRGRRWEETVIYELHVGTFSPGGDFNGVTARLEQLRDLGVTAIELMPVADFPGAHNWGYDGVHLFAPDSRYGRPEALKHLVDRAHRCGLMVFLDVVYNHLGPEGNYLHRYCPAFFTTRHQTNWGDAINYDGEGSRWVRRFVIDNALYWLEEYRFDGLRLDAVHAITDDSRLDILCELAAAVRARFAGEREVHLMLEDDRNRTDHIERADAHPRSYSAAWNDDWHHAAHVLLSGEDSGYYQDYADVPVGHLARCLAQGYAYQGQPSPYRGGTPRGSPSAHLPATAFIAFLQNHDQVGNRALGERLSTLADPAALRAATVLLLLAPTIPLLFMGQEWGATEPFTFFCDFEPGLAEGVAAGRRREFSRFPAFADAAGQARIPDPSDPATFAAAQLRWARRDEPTGHGWCALHQSLLALRARLIVPRLANLHGYNTHVTVLGEQALQAEWRLGDGSRLTLQVNLGAEAVAAAPAAGHCIYTLPVDAGATLEHGQLPGHSASAHLDPAPVP